jgi:hypothetical protein
MPRARCTSIAPTPPAGQGSLSRCLRRWLVYQCRRLEPAVAASAAACRAERYRKHFDAFQHTCLLLFHGLSAHTSLRQSYDTITACRGLVALADLAVAGADEQLTVSFSQFADSNTSRPAAFLSGLIPSLVAQVRQGVRLGDPALPAELAVIDATVLHLSVTLAPWLAQKSGWRIPTGVRVQTCYTPAWDLPEHVVVSTATNDYRGLDELVLDDPVRLAALQARTLVVDLGYYSHQRLAQLTAAGVHWVTRRLTAATVQVVGAEPVPAALQGVPAPRITVLVDQRVTLGSPNNRRGAVLRNVRLVRAQVAPLPAAARLGRQPVVYEVLTDRWDLTALDVVQLYLWRWQIELFFRWLKSHLQLTRLLGYSQNAVEMSVALAIVVHLLTLLAAQALGRARRSPSLLRRVAWALLALTEADLATAEHAEQLALFPLPPPD